MAEDIKNLDVLANAWVDIINGAGFPADFDGTESPEAHRATLNVEERIRDYIVSSSDKRLYGLLWLLGHASLRMEQELWPEEYARLKREVEEAVKEADDPNAEWISHEEAKAIFAKERAKLLKKINDK